MKAFTLIPYAVLLALVGLLSGCATQQGSAVRASTLSRPNTPETTAPAERPINRSDVHDTGWTERVISEAELSSWNEQDPELTRSVCCRILARLNAKAHYHVSDDIRSGRPLKVPNNFSAYKDWTPLPRHLARLSGVSKFILVVKDIPFLGWYEKGRLLDDTYICIGKESDPTNSGLFAVEEKDDDHYSKSYPNSFGGPAWMPYALRIYGRVWIHAGDVTGPHCSPGCITLPVLEAQKLFGWATLGTRVLILESLGDLERNLEANGPRLISQR